MKPATPFRHLLHDSNERTNERTADETTAERKEMNGTGRARTRIGRVGELAQRLVELGQLLDGLVADKRLAHEQNQIGPIHCNQLLRNRTQLAPHSQHRPLLTRFHRNRPKTTKTTTTTT